MAGDSGDYWHVHLLFQRAQSENLQQLRPITDDGKGPLEPRRTLNVPAPLASTRRGERTLCPPEIRPLPLV